MATKGAFYVKNNSSDKITGYVRFKDSPEMEVRFDLNTGEQSESASLNPVPLPMTPGTTVSKRQVKPILGTSPVHTMQKTKIKAPSLWKSLMII
ncbi:hypothetical protein [Vibrio sp. A1-1]|uniref:hypothetical protein n=1 Tax=Vibrio sp. A1-1 TaxID=2912250 RepID=UPI001F1E91A6|nr:hypothetical protein [Vibrio sp. A1-1]MCF7453492.1 hypothetical protein [Vibrio sp. A1-1]